MIHDPIVEAVRKVKEQLAAAHGYDIHAMFADLRRRDVELGDRVRKQPRRQAKDDKQPEAEE